MNLLSKQNQKLAIVAAMAITGYVGLAMLYGWPVPQFLTNKIVATLASGITLAGAYVLYNDY